MINEKKITGEISGNGWMVGPYVSARLAEHMFFDGRVTWGRSDNKARQDIMGLTYKGEFETERLLAKATLSGLWEFAVARFLPVFDEQKDRARVLGTIVLAISCTLAGGAAAMLIVIGFRGVLAGNVGTGFLCPPRRTPLPVFFGQ